MNEIASYSLTSPPQHQITFYKVGPPTHLQSTCAMTISDGVAPTDTKTLEDIHLKIPKKGQENSIVTDLLTCFVEPIGGKYYRSAKDKGNRVPLSLEGKSYVFLLVGRFSCGKVTITDTDKLYTIEGEEAIVLQPKTILVVMN